MSIFGVEVSEEGLQRIGERLEKREGGGATWVVTANPEILLAARKNPLYKQALIEADIRTADGFGLYFFERYLLRRKIERITGVELSKMLVELAHRKNWKLGLLGAAIPFPGTAEKVKKILEGRYPGLRIHAEDGGVVGSSGEDDEAGDEAVHRLRMFQPDILLVAFGHPKQELWIRKHIHDFPGLKAIVGVGGTLDFWAGNVKRAPAFLRKLGLEWAWRLAMEPKRARRILKAVVVFPILALSDILVSKIGLRRREKPD